MQTGVVGKVLGALACGRIHLVVVLGLNKVDYGVLWQQLVCIVAATSAAVDGKFSSACVGR